MSKALSTQISFTQVTAGASAAAVAERPQRHRVIFKNTDSSITIYLGTGTVTSANSLPLLAGESVALETTAAVNCLAASGSPVLSVVEEYV